MKLYTQIDAKWAKNPLKKPYFQSTGIKHNSKEKPNQPINKTKKHTEKYRHFPSKITCTKK